MPASPIDVLQRLGAEPRLRQPCAAADLAGQLGLATRFRPALAWLLDRLTAAGILADAAASGPGAALRYHSTGDWPKPRSQELRQRIKELESASLPTLDLLDVAAAAYPRIAAGEMTGEDALLSPESLPLWLAYFNNGNPLYAVHNRVSAIDASPGWQQRGRCASWKSAPAPAAPPNASCRNWRRAVFSIASSDCW